MSSTAVIGCTVLGAWLLASLCYVLRVPVVAPALARANRCRFFSTWTMFSGRSAVVAGVYVLECCDRKPREPASTWTEVAHGAHWHPLAFALDPHRPIADAIQQFGRALHQTARRPDRARDRRRCEAVLSGYAARARPPAAGDVRELRIVKVIDSRGRRDVVWWFPVTFFRA